MRIGLELHPQHSYAEARRLEYAFRLFCALRGHSPVMKSADKLAMVDCAIVYTDIRRGGPTIKLSRGYRERRLEEPAPGPNKYERNGKRTALIFRPEADAEPDWLGEIFEWVSCADEYSQTARDRFGRMPYSSSYVSRHSLDSSLPYAAFAVELLDEAVWASVGATCPAANAAHFIAATHDVDTLPGSLMDSAKQLFRYAAITALVYRDPVESAGQIARSLRDAFSGKNPFAQHRRLAFREKEAGTHGTYFFIASQHNCRDANYNVLSDGFRAIAEQLQQDGMEIGTHGSFESLEVRGRLSGERATLESVAGAGAGNRQHYLRFTIDKLLREVEQAGFLYDCSLGWSERIGYRGAACFAFPPYLFDGERAARFLELPMAAMDVSLPMRGSPERELEEQVLALIDESRRFGFGGVSILWHPCSFEGTQRPMHLDRVYWNIMKRSRERNDIWTTGLEIVQRVAPRFVECELLEPTYLEKMLEYVTHNRRKSVEAIS